MQDVYLTKKGFEKLKEELKYLKGEKRREIASNLEKARLLGDLSENAEYDSAKQQQALNEKRIYELEDTIGRAKIFDNENIPVDVDKVYIGSKVRLLDMASKEEVCYVLVTQDEADFAKWKIYVSSPVGRALLGKKKDDIVNISVPAGSLRYKIIEISRG